MPPDNRQKSKVVRAAQQRPGWILPDDIGRVMVDRNDDLWRIVDFQDQDAHPVGVIRADRMWKKDECETPEVIITWHSTDGTWHRRHADSYDLIAFVDNPLDLAIRRLEEYGVPPEFFGPAMDWLEERGISRNAGSL